MDWTKDYKDVLWVLGALLSAPALVSFVQHVLQVGLEPAFAEFVQFYRSLVQPVVSIVAAVFRPFFAIFGIALPDWYGDAYTLAVIGNALWMRALSRDLDEKTGETPPASVAGVILGFYLTVAVMLFSGLLFGVFYLLTPFLPTRLLTNFVRYERGPLNKLRRLVLITLAATIAFYVGNAMLRYGS